MPANAVKPGQEDEWKRAKKAAAEQGQAGNHALIMYIFKKMIAKKSLRDRLFDMIKARKPVTGQMGLFGGESTPSKPRAVGPFIGPRGGKWADPKHTIPWKEPRHPIPRPVKPQEPEMVMVKDHFTGKVMGPYELVAAKYDPDIVTLKDPATGKKFKVHGDNLAPVPKEATRKEPPTKGPDRPATPEEVEPDIRYTLYSKHPSSNKWMAERSFYGSYFRPGSEGASYFNRNNYTVMKEGVPPPQIAAPPAEERTSHEEGKTIRTTWLERSLKDRLMDKFQKAEPAQARQEFKIKPRPASDKPKPKPGAVQGSVVKPPAGFTPIPHSKKGGYHKQMGGGKFIYWYPGQGIVGAAHEADAKTTPHQEATAKHVMEQIGALEQKGSITRSDLEHTMQAIHNAWPQGPQDVPRHIMEHYKKLQGMVTGAEEETPEVKIKRPGAKPETVQEFKESVVKERAAEKEAKKEAKEKERAVKKEAAAQKREGKRKAAEEKRQAERKAVRAKVITDHKKVPEGFNKMSKKERAKLTANWDQVKEDLENNYAKGDYMSHPDMRQAITEHIDELADVGQIVPANSGKAKSMLLKQLEYGEKAGIKRQALASLLEENVRKLAHQEVESVKRTLGDHGVRHLSVNAHQANRIFDKLEAAGIRISPMDRFMAGQVMLDHDMGYTIPVIAKGGFAIKDNYHPQASAVLVQQQGAKYRKLFGKDYRDFKRHVETHSGSGVDWKNDPVGSAVRLADNTHLFADKLPEVLFDTDHGVEVLTKLKLADQIVPKSIVTVDKNGKEKRKRTPEEKAEFNALVGGVRDQLAESVKNRADLPESTKKLLANAVAEIGGATPDFAISRLAGRSPEFEYDKKSGDMKVSIEQSPARLAIGEIFGETEKDKQFKKMLEDFGTNPEAAYGHAPPPSTRVGAEGNGIAFTWREPSGDHPAERRYAKVMRDTKTRLNEIQSMKGSAKRAALKRFFGDELAKAMDALINEWALIDSLEELQKAAGGSMMRKAGPFIGPRGGKWADPKHTIPWKEGQTVAPKPKKEKEVEPKKITVKTEKGTEIKITVGEHVDRAILFKVNIPAMGIEGSGDGISADTLSFFGDGADEKRYVVPLPIEEAQKIQAALDTLQAKIDMRPEVRTRKGVRSRRGIVEEIYIARDSAREDAERAWEAANEAGAFRARARGEEEIVRLLAKLKKFDVDHPEVVALVEAEKERQRMRGLERSLKDRLMDKFQKASAMPAMATRQIGRVPLKEKPKMTFKERLGAAIGRRPQGSGWTAIPGGKRGGYRRMVGGKWAYWYHGIGTQDGTQQEAKQHQAKRDIEHHEKQSTKWQERAAKRHASGQAGEHVESARSKMREHAGHARSLREKHGIPAVKSMEKPMAIERSNAMKKGSDAASISKLADKVMGGMELDDAMKQLEGDDAGQKSLLAELRNRKSMGPQDGRGQGKGVQGGRGANRNVESCPEGGPGFGQGKGQGGGRVRKSLRVNTCQVHLEHDAYLAKALDDGDLGIGTVPRTFSSKTMKKAIGGERFTEHGADHREETARAQQAAEIVTYDPDGTGGDGGLPEWFADAQRTQEPMVRTPAKMAKAQEPPTRVIDDDDPYTKRLHHMDPRDGAANMDFAYNRDAKRTQ